MVASSYSSDHGHMWTESERHWLDAEVIFEYLQAHGITTGTNVTKHIDLTLNHMIGIDIRQGVYVKGQQDLFGPLRWIIWKLMKGDANADYVIKKYLQPMPVIGKVKPYIDISMIYDQMNIEFFGRTIELWDWRLAYNEQEESSFFTIYVKMNVYSSKMARDCNEMRDNAELRNQRAEFYVQQCVKVTGQGYKQTARFSSKGVFDSTGFVFTFTQVRSNSLNNNNITTNNNI